MLLAIAQFLPFILLFIVLYLFMIKPQKKREEKTQEMRNSIEVGEYVTTIGGIIGRVVAVRANQITIESGADRVKLHFTKWAVQSKQKEPYSE